MHTENLSDWIHDHVFDEGSFAAERGTRLVMWITAAMMIVEIAAGWWYNSMALLADGWHMSSHAVAIGLSALAYTTARKYSKDPRFAFGTWKIEVLAGFASAIFLLGVALLMVFGSVERILSPQPIHYQEAIVVAVLGLIVNIVCALILGNAHHHGHDHGHDHRHGHSHHGEQHHDLNLKSAYIHVIADAATSVLAIVLSRSGLRGSSPKRARFFWTVKWTIRSSTKSVRSLRPGQILVTPTSPIFMSGVWERRFTPAH
jgi:Co/Zn/Cd efflux system component